MAKAKRNYTGRQIAAKRKAQGQKSKGSGTRPTPRRRPDNSSARPGGTRPTPGNIGNGLSAQQQGPNAGAARLPNGGLARPTGNSERSQQMQQREQEMRNNFDPSSLQKGGDMNRTINAPAVVGSGAESLGGGGGPGATSSGFNELMANMSSQELNNINSRASFNTASATGQANQIGAQVLPQGNAGGSAQGGNSMLQSRTASVQGDNNSNATYNSSDGASQTNAMASSNSQDQQQDQQKSDQPTKNGIFNVGGIMESFYNWQPGENDDEGRAIKNTTAADMVTSAFQTQLATGMAHQQAGISKDMMTHQQYLEREAAGEARKEEYDYGSMMMGQQFDLQNTYANSQYDRDVGMEAAKGQQRRDDLREKGNQDRLSEVIGGEQDRLSIGAKGAVDRANITTQQTAQGKRERDNITEQGSQDRQNITTQQTAQGLREQANIDAQGAQDRANITRQQAAQGEREVTNIREQGAADQANIKTQQSAQGERERGNIDAQGSQDRANIVTQQGAQGSRERGNISAQGDQDRQNIKQQGDTDIKKMEKGDELQAKKSNRQSARSRSLARSF